MDEAPPANPLAAPDLPPPLVPIWDTTVATYRVVGWHLVEFIRGAWLPAILFVATVVAVAAIAALDNIALTVLAALAAIGFIALVFATVSVRWHRTLLLGELPSMGVAAGPRELRSVGYGLLAILLLAAIFLVPGLIGFALAESAPLLSYLALLAGICLAIWLGMRMIAIPSLAAIDAPGNLLVVSWNLMRGLAWRGYWAWFLVYLPIGLLGRVIHVAAEAASTETAADLVTMPVDVLQAMLGIAVGALLFLCAVRLHPPAAPNAGTDIASLALLRAGGQNVP